MTKIRRLPANHLDMPLDELPAWHLAKRLVEVGVDYVEMAKYAALLNDVINTALGDFDSGDVEAGIQVLRDMQRKVRGAAP